MQVYPASLLRTLRHGANLSPAEICKVDTLLTLQLKKATVATFDDFIRSTVQFNLFEGTVQQIGTEEHKRVIKQAFLDGKRIVGAFALTESEAGVLSGLQVDTKAVRLPEGKGWRLNGSKNWISQYRTASHAVVFADTYEGTEKLGINAFFVNLRDLSAKGSLLLTDIGNEKTVALELDNGRMDFKDAILPIGSIMDSRGVGKGFIVVARRLLTGRLGIAQGTLHAMDHYINFGLVPRIESCRPRILNLPSVKSLLDEFRARTLQLYNLTKEAQQRLSAVLDNPNPKGPDPDRDLVELVNVCKIRCVEHCETWLFRLRKAFGSHSLLVKDPPHLDHLLCCRFAEGDVELLRQKTARDALRELKKRPIQFISDNIRGRRSWTSTFYTVATAAFLLCMPEDMSPLEKWQKQWKLVSRLADERIKDVIKNNL